MNRKPELLAPAGSMDAVIAAVQSGCDAIYCGLQRFSARATAVNFSMEEMAEVIRYCHMFGVKVYITVNTLINDDLLEEVVSMVVEAARLGADAFIIQDFGLMRLLNKRYPEIELHASTQMHVHHPSQVELLRTAGITRFVIARETPIETVRKFVHTGSPIEVFVHGALCMSYSGQCQMSYIIGSRSANKGECAQPCRLPYQLLRNQNGQWIPIPGKSPYLLSTADLNTLGHLDELVDAGVTSLKIEGRLKRPEYVAAVVKAYRKKLDDPLAVLEEDQKAMAQMFNRNFTKGHLFHEPSRFFVSGDKPNHIGTPVGIIDEIKGQYMILALSDELRTGDGIRIMNDADEGMTVSRMWFEKNEITSASKGQKVRIYRIEGAKPGDRVHKTTNKSLIDRLRYETENNRRTVSVTGHFTARAGHPMRLMITNGDKRVEITSSDVVEAAKNVFTGIEDIRKQLNKTLDTPYRFSSITWDTDANIFIAVSKINALRRAALQQLSEQAMIDIIERPSVMTAEYEQPSLAFRFSCSKSEHIDLVWESGFRNILISDILLASYCQDKGIPYIWQTPRIHSPKTFENASEWCIGELGQIQPGRKMSGDWPLNVTNRESVRWLLSLKMSSVMLSAECTLDDVATIMKNENADNQGYLPVEVAIYGKREMMVLKHCPVAHTLTDGRQPGCTLCTQHMYALKDRKNKMYPLIKDDMCHMHLFEHQPFDQMSLASTYFDLGVRIFRVTFTDESVEEIHHIVNKCVSLTKNLQQISKL